MPGITTWQYTHPLPYENGISEDTCHELFEQVGRDETLMQNFFASRLKSQGGKALLAYDSTTISTYSGQIPEARYGFNKKRTTAWQPPNCLPFIALKQGSLLLLQSSPATSLTSSR